MSMRTHKLTTYLQVQEACTLIEFLDQVREVLLQAYGDDIIAMLQHDRVTQESLDWLDEEESF
jgi:hypothetical protein